MSAIEIQVVERERATGEDQVVSWRREELERAGYEAETARMLSQLRHVDLHVATALLRDGCRPDLAVEILV